MIKTYSIKDFYGMIIGFIDEDTNTGKKIARSFSGLTLGSYDPYDNTTRNFYGQIISKGDTTSALIYAEANKR